MGKSLDFPVSIGGPSGRCWARSRHNLILIVHWKRGCEEGREREREGAEGEGGKQKSKVKHWLFCGKPVELGEVWKQKTVKQLIHCPDNYVYLVSWPTNWVTIQKENKTYLMRLVVHQHLLTPSNCDDRGWEGWMASPTRRAWVWVNSGSWWWTGRPGALRLMGSQSVGHDWATVTLFSKYLQVSRLLIPSRTFHDWKTSPLNEVSGQSQCEGAEGPVLGGRHSWFECGSSWDSVFLCLGWRWQ